MMQKLYLHVFCKVAEMYWLGNCQNIPLLSMCRSSRPEVFCKRSVLRIFANFTGKHQCQTLFLIKVPDLRLETLLKKRLWHRCFPVNSAKFLRTPFLQNTSGRVRLKLCVWDCTVLWFSALKCWNIVSYIAFFSVTFNQ